jgi:acetoin utilization protein AcuB
MPRSNVRELMTTQPVTLFEDDRLREAVELVTLHNVRHIPVLDRQGRLVGIVTDRDIKQTLPSPLSSAAPEEYEALLETTSLGRVMSRNPLTVDAESDVADAVELLVSRKIGGLPVLDEGILVGIFTERDALRGYLELLRA